ncbi:MAG TPA: YCF48-related protein, partial [Vicinamibacteria bacterium]|nr:YCF48-related protein [Vicinamibacteria bacterium]
MRALAADPHDPRRIYLGTSDGVLYRSEDSGAHWRRLSPGFPRRGQSLDEITVDARGVVLAGYWEVGGSGGGVARSTDGGNTFTILKGIEGQSVRALAIAPASPQILAAGTLTGVFRSIDGGQSWARITPPDHPDLRNFESVAFDPQDPNTLYVGTWHLGWKTVDGGQNWLPMHTGMIDDSDVMTLTVDRWKPQVVYATACTGIYRSEDAAARWTKVKGIPSSSRRTRSFAQSPDDQNRLFAGTTEGLWSSEDNSATWRLITQKNLIINDVLALPGGMVLLGTEGAGVVRSTDGGQTWFASNDGFSERFVSKVVFDRVGRRVLAGIWGDRRHGGVFAAPGPRGPWSRLGAGLEGREVLSLALLGHQALAGTDDGVFVADAETGVWARMSTVVDGVDVHPRVKDLLALPPRNLIAATSKGLLRSSDGGRTWVRPGLGLADEVSALAVSPNDIDVVVAMNALGVFRSGDGGQSWTQVSYGFGDVQPHAVAFMPSDDKVLLATTSGGLYRSEDQGTTWSRVTGGIPYSDITGLAIHPDGRTIYASDFTFGGIFRSVDAGKTWERLPTDGLASDHVWTLGLDPAAPERLLVASPT